MNSSRQNSLMLDNGLTADEKQKSAACVCLLVKEPSLDSSGRVPSFPETRSAYSTNIGSNSCEYVTGHPASRHEQMSAEMTTVKRCMCTVEHILLDGTENRPQSKKVPGDGDVHGHHRADSLTCPAAQHQLQGTHTGTGCDKRPELTSSVAAGSGWTDIRVPQGVPLCHALHRQRFCRHSSDSHYTAFSRPQKELSVKRKHEISNRLSCSWDEINDLSSLFTKRHRIQCACAMMEASFLRMAEAAYTSIGRRDASADFFKQLQQTNSFVTESVDLIGQIKHICERSAHLSAW